MACSLVGAAKTQYSIGSLENVVIYCISTKIRDRQGNYGKFSLISLASFPPGPEVVVPF